MAGRGIKSAAWRCLAWLVFCALVGVLFGEVALVTLLGALGYIVWTFVHAHRLELWVRKLRKSGTNAQDLSGIWAEIAYDVQLMQARHDKEKLRLSAVVSRVQEMTTALTDGVILIDKKGNMEWWNQAAAELFDFRDIDHGHKLTNLIRHPKFIRYFDNANYTAPLELSMWRSNRHLEFQVHPFGEGERLVVARDVTRLYKLEQMRKDFVANVSHELRTPLTVIRGYLETLSDTPGIPSPWQRALQQMEQQGQRMTLLINDLITLAKLETDQKEKQTPVMLGPLLATIVADAKTLSEGRHIFELEGDQDLAIFGCERELRSAFSNLVINAVNYSGRDARIHIKYKAEPDGVIVRISDTGIGIDSKHLARITERFYRVDPGRSVASGGTGLGLAIVKHVLLRHNSELLITSQLGKGSQFTCRFPSSLRVPQPSENMDQAL